MYISRLILKNWKNFQKVDVELQLRTFIIGPNASGKSNFLDAIRFLRDLTKTGGGLQYAVNTVRGGVSKIRCLSARSQPDIEVGIEISDDISKKVLWKYRLLFNQVGGGVRDLYATIKQEQAWNAKNELVLDRDDKRKKEDDRLIQYTHLEQPTSNQKFRPIADFLSEIRYLHLIPHLVRNSRQIIMPEEQADYFGKDLIERINKLNKKTQSSSFKRIEIALKQAVPHLKELTLAKDKNGIPHLQANYEHWRPKGAKQWEGQFSDGTLRLIGLLWALMDGTKPVLLEEPELSLHSAIVSRLAEIIARLQKRKSGIRQVILSTHSYEMLNNKGISGEETILLLPQREGTVAKTASSDKEIRTLLESGMSVGEVVVPMSAPVNVEQLSMDLGI
jgi:predicted ATPase